MTHKPATPLTEWLPGKYAYAWIDSENMVYELPCGNHVEFFENRPDFGAEYARYTITVDHNVDMMNSDLDSLDEDEHPSMHRFDGMNDEARDTLYLEAYNRGWVRFGLSSTRWMEVYGTPDTLDKAKSLYKKLADDIGAKLTLWRVIPPRGKGPSNVFDYEPIRMFKVG